MCSLMKELQGQWEWRPLRSDRLVDSPCMRPTSLHAIITVLFFVCLVLTYTLPPDRERLGGDA
jgi:hypothetical protein